MSLGLSSDGQLLAEGVLDGLNDVASQITELEGGEYFEFSDFVRFGKI